MIEKDHTIAIAGVGGQGVILLSRIIGLAGLKEDYNIRIAETLGMSQRFGSVKTYVRIGHDIKSPLPLNNVDVLLGLEPLEACRCINVIDRKTTAIINSHPIQTLTTLLEVEKYPPLHVLRSMIESRVSKLIWFNATDIAKRKLNDPKQTNIIMLGVYVKINGSILRRDIVEECIVETLGVSRAKIALKAFRLGYELFR